MTPVFIVHYARPGSDVSYITRFFNDLQDEVRARSAGGQNYHGELVGVHPAEWVRTGTEETVAGLSAPVLSSPVLVALLTDEYFRDERCVTEWSVFNERVRWYGQFTGRTAHPPVGVRWSVRGPETPAAITGDAFVAGEFGEAYDEIGALRLMRTAPGSAGYRRLVAAVATAVVEGARESPPVLSPDDVKQVLRALGTGTGSARPAGSAADDADDADDADPDSDPDAGRSPLSNPPRIPAGVPPLPVAPTPVRPPPAQSGSGSGPGAQRASGPEPRPRAGTEPGGGAQPGPSPQSPPTAAPPGTRHRPTPTRAFGTPAADVGVVIVAAAADDQPARRVDRTPYGATAEDWRPFLPGSGDTAFEVVRRSLADNAGLVARCYPAGTTGRASVDESLIVLVVDPWVAASEEHLGLLRRSVEVRPSQRIAGILVVANPADAETAAEGVALRALLRVAVPGAPMAAPGTRVAVPGVRAAVPGAGSVRSPWRAGAVRIWRDDIGDAARLASAAARLVAYARNALLDPTRPGWPLSPGVAAGTGAPGAPVAPGWPVGTSGEATVPAGGQRIRPPAVTGGPTRRPIMHRDTSRTRSGHD